MNARRTTARRATARRTTARPTAVRRLPGLLAVTALGAALLSGCGIRATEVPTDFGPAPSRVRCSLAEPDASKQAVRGLPVQVFLLCGSSLVAVDRTVRVPDGATDSGRRVVVAQGLLDELSAPPSAAEKEAGYTTSVRGGTTVSGPRPGDPEDALRLSTAPGSLSSSALGQIVCTLSDSAAAEGDGSVVLGGPDEAPPRRYKCTDEVRARPAGAEPPSAEVTGE
ncbi:hypothetical protein [Streptomyces sp.]|uniref:hypothetical protein n=1 Tax=Streptomyces sp. TaxID=1931 RepID=UPI002810E8E6|nr:hypothetical protein [Streptomyces sp.]